MSSRPVAVSVVRARLALAALAIVAMLLGSFALFAPRAEAIVGGQLASQDYPNMAAFLYDGNQICGASLIAPQWVISAAHCVDSKDARHYSFRIGGVRDLDGAGGETIQADQVIVHPNYDGGPYDVSLFHLSRPSTYAPIALANPTSDRSFWEPGDEARVIGYGGQVFQMPSLDNQLREVDIPVVADEECDGGTYGLSGGIDEETEVCAGNLHGTEDSCQGDSGGPLMVRNGSGQWIQMGVVSWGLGCAAPTAYGVYARVGDTTLYNWITQTVGSTPTPTPTPTPTDPPGGYETVTVGEQGYIIGGAPLPQITENEFAIECRTPSLGQGVDGYVWELPEELRVPGTIAQANGNAFLYDLDLAFYDSECGFIEAVSTVEANERADIPAGTAYVIANNWLGGDVLVDLTVDVPVP